MDVKSAQSKFLSLVDCVSQKNLPQFAMWLDLKLAEYKVLGQMSADDEESSSCPAWISQGLLRYRLANSFSPTGMFAQQLMQQALMWPQLLAAQMENRKRAMSSSSDVTCKQSKLESTPSSSSSQLSPAPASSISPELKSAALSRETSEGGGQEKPVFPDMLQPEDDPTETEFSFPNSSQAVDLSTRVDLKPSDISSVPGLFDYNRLVAEYSRKEEKSELKQRKLKREISHRVPDEILGDPRAKPLSCPFCEETLPPFQLKNHLHTTHKSKGVQRLLTPSGVVWSCCFCPHQVLDLANCINHVKSIHFRLLRRCGLCGITVAYSTRLTNHHRSVHGLQ